MTRHMYHISQLDMKPCATTKMLKEVSSQMKILHISQLNSEHGQLEFVFKLITKKIKYYLSHDIIKVSKKGFLISNIFQVTIPNYPFQHPHNVFQTYNLKPTPEEARLEAAQFVLACLRISPEYLCNISSFNPASIPQVIRIKIYLVDFKRIICYWLV